VAFYLNVCNTDTQCPDFKKLNESFYFQNKCVCVCMQLRMGILYMVCVLHILVQNHKVLLHSELNGYMTK